MIMKRITALISVIAMFSAITAFAAAGDYTITPNTSNLKMDIFVEAYPYARVAVLAEYSPMDPSAGEPFWYMDAVDLGAGVSTHTFTVDLPIELKYMIVDYTVSVNGAAGDASTTKSFVHGGKDGGAAIFFTMDEMVPNDHLVLSATVSNWGAAKTMPAMKAIIVVYDNVTDEVLYVTFDDVDAPTLAAGGAWLNDIVDLWVSNGNWYAKAFLWDGLGGLKPLADSKKLPN